MNQEERDRKDAARYRFMRDHATHGDRETWFFTHANDEIGNEAAADAAIDAAMEEQAAREQENEKHDRLSREDDDAARGRHRGGL